jgi:hypothetical protein
MSPPEVLREVGGLGEALEEVVKEVVEAVEALGIYRRPLKACLVNFRCKICPAVEACLLARLRYVVVECAFRALFHMTDPPLWALTGGTRLIF